MTKEMLKSKLEEVNETRKNPRSDIEINDILTKYQKSIENRKAMDIANESVKSKLSKIMKQFKPGDVRVFACGGLGIFVKKNSDGTADVAFSFLNLHDAEDKNFKLTVKETKYHAALNYTLQKYTYKVEWKGRSEFAIYDAFIEHKDEFPSIYKELSIGLHVMSPQYENQEGNVDRAIFPIEV